MPCNDSAVPVEFFNQQSFAVTVTRPIHLANELNYLVDHSRSFLHP